MSLGKRLFIGDAECLTDDVNPFTGDSADGGVALYTLDSDGSDAGGNYDGTSSNVTFSEAGQINNSARFSTTNGSKITTTINNTVLPVTSDFSVSAWFKYNSVSGSTSNLGMMNTSGSYNGWAFFAAGSTFTIAWNGAAPGFTTGSGYTITTGQWFHAVMTYDGSGTTKMYIDGSLQGTKTSQTINAPSVYLIMGDGDVWDSQDANLDQVRIFDRELSESQVQTLEAEEAC